MANLHKSVIDSAHSDGPHSFEWPSNMTDEKFRTSGTSLRMTENKLSTPFLAIQSES